MPQYTVDAPVNEDAKLRILKPGPGGRVFRRRVIRRRPGWTLGGLGRGIDIRGVGSRSANRVTHTTAATTEQLITGSKATFAAGRLMLPTGFELTWKEVLSVNEWGRTCLNKQAHVSRALTCRSAAPIHLNSEFLSEHRLGLQCKISGFAVSSIDDLNMIALVLGH